MTQKPATMAAMATTPPPASHRRLRLRRVVEVGWGLGLHENADPLAVSIE